MAFLLSSGSELGYALLTLRFEASASSISEEKESEVSVFKMKNQNWCYTQTEIFKNQQIRCKVNI